MSRTNRLIKRLDKALADYTTFGSHPDAFVDELFAEIEDDVQVLLGKSKPSHWEEMYVERDRAIVKTLVLNRAMSMGASD